MNTRYRWFAERAASAAAVAAATAGALLMAGCDNPAAQAAAAPAAPPPITAALVTEKSLAETQEFSGRMEAVDRAEIRPRVSGLIASINFKPGSLVKKGDLLFVIDPRPYQAEANRADAMAASARAKADLAKLEYARAEKLVAEKAIAQREADEKSSSLRELDATARAAQAAADAAKLNLGFTRVTSPISGRASKAEVTEGNLVDGTVVLTSVVSANPIYATFNGDEDTYLRVARSSRKGEPVAVRIGLANEAGFPHEGKLEFIDNRVDPATGSVRMRATFDNTDDVLAPGLFARVQLGGGVATKSAVIAERAVGTDQNRKFVFVVNAEGKAEYRAVTLGPIIDGMRVVRDGLKPGEKIIVNGLQRVQPGAPVTAQMVPMDADPNAPAQSPAKPAAKTAGGSADSASAAIVPVK